MKVKYLAAVSPHQHRLFFPSTSSPDLLNPAFLGQTTKPHHLKEKNIPTAPHHSRYGNSPKCDPNSQIPCPGGQRYPFHQLLGWMDADHSGQVVGKGLGLPPVPAHPCRGGGEAAGFGVLGLMPARWDGARDGSMVMGNDQTLSHLEAADIKINLKSTGECRKNPLGDFEPVVCLETLHWNLGAISFLWSRAATKASHTLWGHTYFPWTHRGLMPCIPSCGTWQRGEQQSVALGL